MKLTSPQPTKKFPSIHETLRFITVVIHNSPQLLPVLSQIKPVQFLVPCFFKPLFNIILPPTRNCLKLEVIPCQFRPIHIFTTYFSNIRLLISSRFIHGLPTNALQVISTTKLCIFSCLPIQYACPSHDLKITASVLQKRAT